jgi:hypothetical protein
VTRSEPSGRSGMAPVLTVGIAMLVAGLALLLAGDAFFAGDPAERSLWTALVGILLILAALVYLALPSPQPERRTAPRTVPQAVPRAAPPASIASPAPEPAEVPVVAPVAAAPAPSEPPVAEPPAPAAPALLPTPLVSAAPSVQRAAALAAEGPDVPSGAPRSSIATSIPAAYLQALATDRSSADAWAEVAPPIAAALPFSPGIRRSSDPAPPWDESSDGSEHEAPRLELELARLRARVRELEIPTRASASALTFPRPPGAPTSAKEPPKPPVTVAAGPKGCVACGTGLSATRPPHLCWGCGRTLCSTCYWRFGPGPGLHRCPECMSRAPSGSESISGGRVSPSTTGLVASTAAAPRAPAR